MRYRAIALMATLILAGCQKKAEEAEVNQVVAAPAPSQIEPGLYRQATTLVELEDKTMSPEQAIVTGSIAMTAAVLDLLGPGGASATQ